MEPHAAGTTAVSSTPDDARDADATAADDDDDDIVDLIIGTGVWSGGVS
jgi:hypothetical protein